MSLVRRIARPLLAATFISGGIDTLRKPASRVAAADRVLAPLVDRVPQLSNTEQVVKIDAAVKVVAGSLLAIGRVPRLSATVLVASIIPTTAAGHPFWQERDPAQRTQQRLHFFKNAGMLGGLLLAAVDTEGRPSLGWWARRAPAIVSHTATGLRRDTELALLSAGHTMREKLPV
jgi:putative oxidoreductase